VPDAKKRVLVLCTGNSCRSQMAEGWIRALRGDRWEVSSAGTHPVHAIHPLAVRAMAEVGIDISGNRPQAVERFLNDPWDLVVTVCDYAQQDCPVFPRPVPKQHVSFYDPAQAQGTDDERMVVFRRIRDEIHDRLLPEIDRFD
jgi:arsenate reductase (thioredoxin)